MKEGKEGRRERERERKKPRGPFVWLVLVKFTTFLVQIQIKILASRM